MSWEKPVIHGAMSVYYGAKQGFYDQPIASLGAFLIDQLEEKLHHQHTVSGQESITYTWWNSIDPKEKLDIPSVAIGIDLIDDPRKMNFGVFQDGVHIPADLKIGYINIITLARSVQMRDVIDDHVTAVLEKIILTESGHPILWVTKDEQPRDVNFSTTVDHMASTQFQVMTELGFTKLSRLTFGVVRDYLSIYEYDDGSNESDPMFNALIKTSELDLNEEGGGHIPTWRSFKLTFTSDY